MFVFGSIWIDPDGAFNDRIDPDGAFDDLD
jgi:hypothetical protein